MTARRLVATGKMQSRIGKPNKENGGMLKKVYGDDQEAGRGWERLTKMIGQKFHQGKQRPGVCSQEHVVEIQESTAKCRTALLELVEGTAMGSP